MPERPEKVTREELLNDGTTQLLSGGSLILAVGLVAFLLLMTVLGGVSVEGAHSNPGWLALIVAMMCLPFGLLLTILGVAKWLRRRPLLNPSQKGNRNSL
jgi:NhaP-type Na+/H+ or K+/H+ antiporter